MKNNLYIFGLYNYLFFSTFQRGYFAVIFRTFQGLATADGGGVFVPQFLFAFGPITTSRTPPEAISS